MTIHQVTSTAEFDIAVSAAVSGDTIELAGGQEYYLDFKRKSWGPAGLTVTATGDFNFLYVEGTRVKYLTIDLSDGAGGRYTATHTGSLVNVDSYVCQFWGANNTTIKNGIWKGQLDGAPHYGGRGRGVSFTGGCSNITLDNNKYFQFYTIVTAGDVDGLTIKNNEFTYWSGDAFKSYYVRNVLIENNYFHDAVYGGGIVHRDMIQLMSVSTSYPGPSENITVRGNLLDIGNGSWTQTIFMRNEIVDLGKAGANMRYKNIVIEENTVYSAHLHGCSIGETDGLIIRKNALLRPTVNMSAGANDEITNKNTYIPSINLSNKAIPSINITVEDNVCRSLNNENLYEWGTTNTKTNNVFLEPTEYDASFDYGSVGPTYPNQWTAKAGGAVATAQAGSTLILTGEGYAEPPALPVMPADGQVTLAFTVG